MSVSIAEPGQVAVVQVPASWSPRDVRQEQGRVQRHIAKYGVPVHVVVVAGGEESSGAAEAITAVLNGAAEPQPA